MGWSYAHWSKSDLIRNLTMDERFKDNSLTECVKHCIRGNVLWTIHRHTDPNGHETDRWIGCNLLSYADGMWGYKDMSESEHPYYYSCPLGYLDIVPVVSEEWRGKVKDYHERLTRWRK